MSECAAAAEAAGVTVDCATVWEFIVLVLGKTCVRCVGATPLFGRWAIKTRYITGEGGCFLVYKEARRSAIRDERPRSGGRPR